MSKFKKLIDKAVADGDTKTMHSLTAVIDEHLMELEAEYPDLYWEVVADLHEVVNGEHFDEAMATWAVSQMDNEDGTTGEHWTEMETSSVAASEGITFDKYNKWDWYYALNMWYSDFYMIIGNNVAMYVKFTKAWLSDKDVDGSTKAWEYWSEIVC